MGLLKAVENDVTETLHNSIIEELDTADRKKAVENWNLVFTPKKASTAVCICSKPDVGEVKLDSNASRHQDGLAGLGAILWDE